MLHTTSVSPDGKYIIVDVQDNVTRESATELVTELHVLGKALGINRYLMDFTKSRNIDSTINNYEFAYKDMQDTDKIDRYAKIAALVDPEDHSHDFIETVSKNAGFSLTIFWDRQLAVEYLLSR